MNFISKWFWKRAVRHEMLSAAKGISLVAGVLLIAGGLIGGQLVLGLILGAGTILLSGRLKHRLWAAGFLIVGIVAYATMGGILGEGGAILVIVAAGLGLASTAV